MVLRLHHPYLCTSVLPLLFNFELYLLELLHIPELLPPLPALKICFRSLKRQAEVVASQGNPSLGPAMASNVPVTLDTLITVKVSIQGSNRKFKIPLRDLGASTLPDKVRLSVCSSASVARL